MSLYRQDHVTLYRQPRPVVPRMWLGSDPNSSSRQGANLSLKSGKHIMIACSYWLVLRECVRSVQETFSIIIGSVALSTASSVSLRLRRNSQPIRGDNVESSPIHLCYNQCF